MDLSDLLNSAAGKAVLNNVSGQLGLNEKDASSAIGAAIPVILAGLTRNAQSGEGAKSLDNALSSKHDGSLLDNLSSVLQGNSQALQQDGSGILGHIFGNQLGQVESGISQKTGIGMDKIASLLPLLAPIVMAYLGRQKQQNNVSSGGLGDLLGSMLGNAQPKSSGGGLMDIVTGMLDKNNDGNIVDDLLGKFFK